MFCELTAEQTKIINHFCSSKGLIEVFHCTFIVYHILFYISVSIVLTKKILSLHDCYCCATVKKENKVLQTWHVLAFYKLALCLIRVESVLPLHGKTNTENSI